MLMANHQNLQTLPRWPVNHRIGKAAKRLDAQTTRCQSAQFRVPLQQTDHSLEFVQEGTSEGDASSFPVKLRSLREFLRCLGVQRIGHFSLDRSSARTCSPGINLASPLSISAARRVASWIQASCISGSLSRLAIRRSRSLDRSSADKLRISASRTARGVDMTDSEAGILPLSKACHNSALKPNRG